ncbi:hypothetical protein EIN_516570 [Entamoeba invadens IP1]|uniref:CCHC-type domain-containing protein n=1 Tax=Entamoeba invadens IP1 TaxID=370355 RepID=L7FM06_ENTIV|nr:hypothetical protein EIN_516570 [Entamoeba invadens IP1]ELP89725.1 hypothetical protein EIN_516570 [Entamoeba invadens IP1]|eukprot:XP_004256496.1 hypothetical protein EIN_516570 [Entamoeba invadens IP1]
MTTKEKKTPSIKIRGLNPETTDIAINNLLVGFSVISLKIPRHETDIPSGVCVVTTDNSVISADVIKFGNNKKWCKKIMEVVVDPKDKMQTTLRITYNPEKSKEELIEYFKKFTFNSVELEFIKAGQLKGDVEVEVDDLKTLNKIRQKLDKYNFEGKELSVVAFNKYGKKMVPCYVCGEVGHAQKFCPVAAQQKAVKIAKLKEDAKNRRNGVVRELPKKQETTSKQ